MPLPTQRVASERAVAEHILKLVTTPEELLEATVDETRAAGVAVDFEKIVGLNLAPGQAGPLETVELPMTWETVLRYEDELYAKHQMCIGARDES